MSDDERSLTGEASNWRRVPVDLKGRNGITLVATVSVVEMSIIV
jgi:hypothetical protein